MKKKLTKKAFEQLLNEKYGFDGQKWGNGRYQARKRPYGTYLRGFDKETFDRWYNEYCETGKLEG